MILRFLNLPKDLSKFFCSRPATYAIAIYIGQCGWTPTELSAIWTLSGPYLDSMRTLSGLYLDPIYTLSGIYLNSIWTLSGPYPDSIWTLSRLYLDSIWTLSWLYLDPIRTLSGPYPDSIWILSRLYLGMINKIVPAHLQTWREASLVSIIVTRSRDHWSAGCISVW